MNLVELNEKEFSKFLNACPAANFLQSVEMFHRYKSRGNEAYLLGAEKNGKILAAGLFVTKRKVLGGKIFTCPRGPMLDFDSKTSPKLLQDFLGSVKTFLKQKGGIALVVAPNFKRVVETDDKGNLLREKDSGRFKELRDILASSGAKNLGENEFVKWIYTLPLANLTEENLYSHFRSGHREAVRLSTSRYGMRLREIDGGELDKLDEIVHAAGVRHGFPDPGLSYYQEMLEAFGKKCTFILAEMPKTVIEKYEAGDREGAKKEAAISNEKFGESSWYSGDKSMLAVAGAMFIEDQNELIYLYSGQLAQYKKFGGPHLIQFEMMKRAIRLKKPLYNFYGTNPIPGDGVYEFKRGFHGRVEEYTGTYIFPLSLKGKLYSAHQKYSDMKNLH